MAHGPRNKAFSDFDLDLNFGWKWEDFIEEKFQTAEVKTERDLWRKTGNIAIEYACSGKRSGVESTNADLWIHNLTDKDEYVMGFIIPTKTMKAIYKEGYKVSGGDRDAARMSLLKIRQLVVTEVTKPSFFACLKNSGR